MLVSKLAGLALALALLLDPFEFEFSAQTDGKGQAYLLVRANEKMPPVDVTIKGDGQNIQRTIPGLKKGGSYKLVWKQRSAKADYNLHIDAGDQSTDYNFAVVKAKARGKLGKLAVLSSRDEIVNKHKARYKTTFNLVKYDYKVYDTNGDIVLDKTVDKGVDAGGTFVVEWNTEDVFMIYVRGEDDLGRFTEYKLVPWAVEIPHTEINFDSAKHNIKSGEAPKIDEALAVAFHELAALDKVNKAVQSNLTPKLYIVGYTDTVGKGPYNQKLSERRARSIAKYFHDKGFWAEIWYAGMGERGQRVKTPDSTDEVRNRRALYLLAVQQPNPGGQIPGRWSRLASARERPPGFELPALPERWAKHKEKQKGSETGAGTSSLIGTDAGDEDGGVGDDGMGDDDGGFGDDDGGYGDDGGPPEIGDEPGATAKGCKGSIGDPVGPLGLSLGLVALLGLRRRMPW